jgi:hypothetical protein
VRCRGARRKCQCSARFRLDTVSLATCTERGSSPGRTQEASSSSWPECRGCRVAENELRVFAARSRSENSVGRTREAATGGLVWRFHSAGRVSRGRNVAPSVRSAKRDRRVEVASRVFSLAVGVIGACRVDGRGRGRRGLPAHGMHAQVGLACRSRIEWCVHGAMARSGERMRMRISGAWQCGHLRGSSGGVGSAPGEMSGWSIGSCEGSDVGVA